MKRALLWLFVLASLVCTITPAHAEWVTKPVRWLETYVGGASGTSIMVRDTLWDVIAAGQVDTTIAFSIEDLDVPPRGVAISGSQSIGTGGGATPALSGAGNDTTIVAWLVVMADSSAAITPTLTAATCLFDGRINPIRAASSTPNTGWVKCDSALVNGAAGGTLILANETVAFPIRSITPYGSIFRFQSLRARITGGTGILTSARAVLRYWKN